MYIPNQYDVSDRTKLVAVMESNSFATVVTNGDDGLFASHVPVLFFPQRGPSGVLTAHVARANPQWRHLRSDREVLVIFQGPHGYISPNWYKTPVAVPTWNYVAVHAYGFPRLLEQAQALAALLHATVEKYESALPTPWKGDLPEDFKTRMMNAIVGFEIEITRLEGKFKLGQNRPPEDIAGAVEILGRSRNQTDRELAQLMADEHPGKQIQD